MWDEKGWRREKARGRRREKARGRECKREEEREEGKEERGRGEAGYSKDSKKGLDSLIPRLSPCANDGKLGGAWEQG